MSRFGFAVNSAGDGKKSGIIVTSPIGSSVYSISFEYGFFRDYISGRSYSGFIYNVNVGV